MSPNTPSGLLIKQIHDCLEKNANNALRSRDTTMMQVSVLMALQAAPDKQLSMKALEHHFQIAQSTAAGIISRLEQKGFVEARSDAADKRVKLVHITAAGEACCCDAAGLRDEAEAVMHRGLTREQRELLNILLSKVLENLQ
ncbi:MAG: MarR family winged helix-turn-helix transcriptional regulator [Butyricicoccaceae bacterium]